MLLYWILFRLSACILDLITSSGKEIIQDNTPAIPPAIISLLNCVTLESRSLLRVQKWSLSDIKIIYMYYEFWVHSYNWAVSESNYFRKSIFHKQGHHDKLWPRHHDRFRPFHVGWIFSWHMPFWKGYYCSSPFLTKVNRLIKVNRVILTGDQP